MNVRNETAKILSVFKEAGARMANDQTLMMGAALAYYMMFSIAPLLIIAIGAAGLLFGRGVDGGVFDELGSLVGVPAAQAVRSMVAAAAARPHAGLVATALGVTTMIVGASGVFSQLQASLNMIWRVAAKPGATWRVLIRQRLLSFGMIAVFGLLMLVSLVASAVLAAAGQWAGGVMPGGKLLWSTVNVAVSFGIIASLFSAVLKFLPDVELSWSDVRVGGAFTAALFVIGKAAIGAYIGRSGFASGYGAAGSLIVILLWVYYASQIVFFGAEFTRAWALREGRRVEPKDGAELTPDPFAGELLDPREAARRARRARAPRPSLSARVLARIPLRVKLAAARGALREGGREAARELAARLRAK